MPVHSHLARSRRHHPYDTPFRHHAEHRTAPAADRAGTLLFATLSGAICAAALWALITPLAV
ncbi:MAG: hypothetical protein RIS94_1301 [Pseudomonadota bacterium]|jgi:hypothetical protein